ncbi:MAG: protocatechuate 3,4-dioxygenase subunit alpha [Stellaceae bacterium]
MPSATGGQTIGPFWHLIEHPEWADLTRFGATGTPITLVGSVVDGDGNAVTDAAVELWQSDPPADDRFPGFGRCRTDERGEFQFTTLKPGPVRGRGNAQQAPHFAITLHARGLLKGLVTRAYFAGEPLNETDPLLSSIEDPVRRATLLARPDRADRWRIDIRLQRGAHSETETVFLDI